MSTEPIGRRIDSLSLRDSGILRELLAALSPQPDLEIHLDTVIARARNAPRHPESSPARQTFQY